MHHLRGEASAEAGRLLRVLLLRVRPLSPHSGAAIRPRRSLGVLPMSGQLRADGARCRSEARSSRSKDLASGLVTYGIVWGVPIAAIAAALFLDVYWRMIIWTGALLWMGLACILNARRCGRTHCKFTGPFYAAMVIPVLALGNTMYASSIFAWMALGAFIVFGSKVIWWATERAWGKYS